MNSHIFLYALTLRDTWLLETPVPPIARTRSSTERVEAPCVELHLTGV